MNNLTKILTAQEALTIQSSKTFKLDTESLSEEDRIRFIHGWKTNGGYIETDVNPDFGGDPFCCPWLYQDVIEVNGHTPEEWGAAWWEKCRAEVLSVALTDEKKVWEERHNLKIETLSEDLHNAYEAVRVFGTNSIFPVYIEKKTGCIFSWATPDCATARLSGSIPIGHHTALSGSELVTSLKKELHICQEDVFTPHRDFSLWDEYQKMTSGNLNL